MIDAGELEREIAAAARRDPRRAAARARRARGRYRDPADRARLLRAEASALHALGRHREVLPLYRRARAAFEKAGLAGETARIDLGLSDVLAHLGRPAEALRAADGARRRFLADGKPTAAAMADANAAGVDWRRDRPRPARNRYLRARRVFGEAGHRFGTAVCDLNLGNVLASLDARAEAREAYARARKAFAALDLPALVAETDYNEAWLAAMEDRAGEAAALLDRAESRFRALGDARHLALIALDRGEVRLRTGLLAEAAEDLARAERAFRGLRLRADRARALALLGFARALAGDPSGAREPLAAARRLFLREGNPVGTATVDLYRAAADLKAGRDPSPAAARARGAFRRAGLRAREAQALVLEAEGSGDPALARRALRRLGGLRAPSLAFAARRVLARAAAEAGRRAAAARHYAAAVGEAERIREGFTADEMRIAFLGDRESLFEECARFLLAGGGRDAPRRALEVLERARGRALLDLALFGRPAPIPRGGAEVERLREALRFAYNRMAGIAGDRMRGAPSAGSVRRLEARLERALGRARRGGAAAPPPEAGAILAALPAGTTVAEYLLGEEDGLALLATREGVEAVGGLPGRARAREAAAAVRYEMDRFALGGEFAARHAERLRADAAEALERARREFLDPILGRVATPRLAVVPHGPLHGLPFPALLPERPVTVAPSLRFLAGGGGRAPRGRPLLVGVPSGEGGATAEEARALGRLLPGARVLEGAAATREAFLEEAPRAPLVHVATHGIFRDDNPLASALRLADGWLAAHEVLSVRLRARLVILSACESGSAGLAPGDEILGLPRGFLGAGARAVLASLWRVPDRPTRDLMEAIHAGLRRGLPVDEALRRVQGEARARGDHPASWAAFVPFGPAVTVVTPPRGPRRGRGASSSTEPTRERCSP